MNDSDGAWQAPSHCGLAPLTHDAFLEFHRRTTILQHGGQRVSFGIRSTSRASKVRVNNSLREQARGQPGRPQSDGQREEDEEDERKRRRPRRRGAASRRWRVWWREWHTAQMRPCRHFAWISWITHKSGERSAVSHLVSVLNLLTLQRSGRGAEEKKQVAD